MPQGSTGVLGFFHADILRSGSFRPYLFSDRFFWYSNRR